LHYVTRFAFASRRIFRPLTGLATLLLHLSLQFLAKPHTDHEPGVSLQDAWRSPAAWLILPLVHRTVSPIACLPLYGELEAAHLDVRMVNGRQTRSLPGRKTDMADCQWGSTLHMHGLLRAGFVPPADIRRLQDYLRLRADHIDTAASCVQLMQKALERMNIKLHDVMPR